MPPSSPRWAFTRTSGRSRGFWSSSTFTASGAWKPAPAAPPPRARRPGPREAPLGRVASDGQDRRELLAFALAYRAFAVENEALYGLMFERATPDFVPSDASRLAGLATFEMLVTRIADWRPDLTDPAADAHLVWATMHGLVTIELMHTRWGGPLVAHLQGDPERNYATAIGSLLEALHGR